MQSRLDAYESRLDAYGSRLNAIDADRMAMYRDNTILDFLRKAHEMLPKMAERESKARSDTALSLPVSSRGHDTSYLTRFAESISEKDLISLNVHRKYLRELHEAADVSNVSLLSKPLLMVLVDSTSERVCIRERRTFRPVSLRPRKSEWSRLSLLGRTVPVRLWRDGGGSCTSVRLSSGVSMLS
jgi:hypothetical protein